MRTVKVALLPSALVAMLLSGCEVAPSSQANDFPPLGLEAMEATLNARQAPQPAAQPAADAPAAAVPAAAAQAEAAPQRVSPAAPAATAPVVPAGQIPTEPIRAASGVSSAVAAFIAACVQTADNPNAARAALEALGFRPAGRTRMGERFESAEATAILSQNTQGGGYGQCDVTPESGTFAAVVPELRAAIAQSGVPTSQLPGEEAWLLGNTGAVALVSRSGGAMTRTQPGVFRG